MNNRGDTEPTDPSAVAEAELDALGRRASELVDAGDVELGAAVASYCADQGGECQVIAGAERAGEEGCQALLEQALAALSRGELSVARVGLGHGLNWSQQLEDAALLQANYVIGLMTGTLLAGDTDAALELGLRALELHTASVEDASANSSVLARIGELSEQALDHQKQGDSIAAESCYAELDPLVSTIEDDDLRHQILVGIGINRVGHLDASGHPDAAVRCAIDTLHVLNQLPSSPHWQEGRAIVDMHLALVLSGMERFDESERIAQEAQQAFETLPDSTSARRYLAVTLLNRADNLRNSGRSVDAEQIYVAAEQVLGQFESADSDDLAQLRLGQAANCHQLGDFLNAAVLNEEARRLIRTLPSSPVLDRSFAGALLNEALARRELGQLREAEGLYVRAQSLFDGLPSSDRQRSACALVRINRGENLEALGMSEQAEETYAAAQQVLEGVPSDSLVLRLDRAAVRVNRANLRHSRGEYADAEAFFHEADQLYDSLPHSARARLARAQALLNRAVNLQALQQFEQAERRLSAAEACLRDVPEAASSLARAAILMNRGNNLNLLERSDDAEHMLRAAQERYDAMADSDAARVNRATARANRLANLLEVSGGASQVEALWSECFDLLLSVQGFPGPGLVSVATLLVQSMTELSRLFPEARATHEQRVLALNAWALDWLDLADDPTSDAPAGSENIATLNGLVLGWLFEHTGAARIPSVLAECFGRYAAAERRSDPDHSSDPSTPSVTALRQDLHQLSAQLQALESSPEVLASSASQREKREALLAQREHAVTTLKSALRNLAGVEDSASDVSLHRIEQALRSGVSGHRPALLVLFRYNEVLHEPGIALHTRSRPAALLFRVGATEPSVLPLPDELLEVTRRRSTSREPSARGGVSAPLRSREGGADAGGIDGQELRDAVRLGLQHLGSNLDDTDLWIVAAHHELGLLPWQASDDVRPLRMFHGVRAALAALERARPSERIAAPRAGRAIGVLAHSPDPQEVAALGADFPPIPSVFADFTLTLAQWPDAHVVLAGKDDLLGATTPLVQLSCHGTPRHAYTGPGSTCTSAYELSMALSHRDDCGSVEALLNIACASAQPGTNAFGEFGGWSAVLGTTSSVLGALFPVDDFYCSLFVLLLHRAWARLDDLRAALSDTRRRLRSGDWADNASETQSVVRDWVTALRGAHTRHAASKATIETLEARAHAAFDRRRDLYISDRRLRLLTEAFVIVG